MNSLICFIWKKGLDRFNWVARFRYRDVVLLQPNSLCHRNRDGRRIATSCRIGFLESSCRLRPGNPVESRFPEYLLAISIAWLLLELYNFNEHIRRQFH
jgi:hypothetical protein